MAKMNLNTILTKQDKFKGKPLQTLIDQSWYQFQNWYKKWPDMFDEDVHEYVREISRSLGKNNVSYGKEIRKRVAQEYT